MNPFIFQPPTWINTAAPDTAEEALKRADDIASAYYAAGTQTGIHAMIEWCGVMTEYVKMLHEAHKAGLDPRDVDKHHGTAVKVPAFMIDYFAEKLGCQLIPFIKGNPDEWKEAIDGWFAEAAEHEEKPGKKKPGKAVGTKLHAVVIEGIAKAVELWPYEMLDENGLKRDVAARSAVTKTTHSNRENRDHNTSPYANTQDTRTQESENESEGDRSDNLRYEVMRSVSREDDTRRKAHQLILQRAHEEDRRL